jgi:hypothetical protein
MDEIKHYVSKRKAGKPLGPGFPHYKNKAERKLAAALCQKAGVFEEVLREDPVMRQRLAKARQSASASTYESRWRRFQLKLKELRRQLARELGVQPYDPAVDKALHTQSFNTLRFDRTPYERLKRKIYGW